MIARRLSMAMAICMVASIGQIAGPGWAQEDPIYERIMKEKKLRVMAIQYAPQSFREQTGEEWKGFDADVYRAFGKKLGVEVEPVFAATAAMVQTITSGRADMGIALFKSPERAQVLDFTDPYKWVTEHIFVHSDDKQTQSMRDLKSKTVGVPRGSASERAARKMQEEGHIKEVRQYETADAMMLDLRAKRVDAVVAQLVFFQWMMQQNPDLQGRNAFEIDPRFYNQTGRTPSAFPMVKNAPKLMEAINKLIQEMQAKNEFAPIFAQYGITDPIVWTPPK